MNNKIITPLEASNKVKKSIAKRRAKDNRLKLYGRTAISLAICFLLILFYSIFSKGYSGFFQYYVTLDINFDRERIDPKGDLSDNSLFDGEASKIVNESLFSIGANLISRSIPLNNKKTKEEPTKRPITTNLFLEISSVNSLNKMACDRNHTKGKAPSAKKEMPKLKSLSCCVLFFIITLHKL